MNIQQTLRLVDHDVDIFFDNQQKLIDFAHNILALTKEQSDEQ